MKKFYISPGLMKELGLFALVFGIIFLVMAVGAYVLSAEQAPKHDIVFCRAPWCSGCTAMKPVIKELEKEGYSVYRPTQKEWPKYGVTRIPTTIVYSNGVEAMRFEGIFTKTAIKAYLINVVTKKRIKVVIAGYDDRRVTISIMGRVLKEEGIELIHLEKRDYRKYKIKDVPTVIFFENGVEKYRLSACGDCDHCKS